MRKHTTKILNVILCTALFCTFSVNNIFAQTYWNVGGNGSLGGNQPLLGPTTNDFLGLITNNTRRVTILSGGNVGIGTASPNNLLQVLGLINFDDAKYTTVIGKSAGTSNTGNYNTLVGYTAGYSNTGGAAGSAFGYQALYTNTTGANNNAFGYSALYSNTTGAYNIAFGDNALRYNTTGYGNIAAGQGALNNNTTAYYNIGIGYNALYSNTEGYYNAGIGMQALYSNTTGQYNTGIGSQSLYSNKAGSGATAIGYKAMYYAYDGTTAFTNYNVALGYEALRGSTTAANNSGNYNTALGYQTLWSNTTASNNIALGYQSAFNNTTAENNIAIGIDALYTQSYNNDNRTYSSDNVAIGYKSLYSNQPSTSLDGFQNTAIGNYTLYSNTTGVNNCAFGYNALYSNNQGSYNLATGLNALYNNITGSANCAYGIYALISNTTGNENCAIGEFALRYNIDGDVNSAFGEAALEYNTSGSLNTAFGADALQNNTTGFENTATGFESLRTNTTGNFNTALGSNSDVSSDGLSGAMSLGYNAKTNANNKIVIGTISNNNLTGGYGTWQNWSDGRFKENVKEDVPGLAFINKLRPVTYTFDAQKIDEFLGIKQRMDTIKDEKAKTRYYDRLKEVSSTTQTGFIAQEVETTANEIGYKFDGVHSPVNDKDNYTLGYATFVVPLVKAVQELNKINDSLKTIINSQQAKIDTLNSKKLNERLSQLEALVNQCCNINPGKKSISYQETDLNNGNAVVLDQNVPNPFAESTTISYFIPDNIGSAQIIFTDNLGRIMKTVDIKEKGQGMLKVYAQDLSTGIYSYTLIADGRTIDSKKMVKTK